MELPETGIYCVAKASSAHHVESTALLPYPIDLSKQRAELGIKYIAVTPNWKYASDLFVTVTDKPTPEPEVKEEEEEIFHEMDDDETIIFEDIIIESADDAVMNLRKQLEAHNGKAKKPLLKIVNHASNKYSVFRLREDAKVVFSHGMAQVFGVVADRPYFSKSNKTLDIPITVREEDLTSSTDIYYLKSDQIQSNYLLDNKQDKIIEVLHIPGIQTRDFHPTLTYVETDTNLLERIKFTLYNASNQIVASENCDMYIICHLRPTKRFFSTFTI